MLKDLILIENEIYKQFSSERELIEYLLGNNYYSLSQDEQIRLMQNNAVAKCYGTDINVTKLTAEGRNLDIKDKFVIYDEKTYVLSLLLANRITILENKNANIFTGLLDKSKLQDNYVIVNKFAEKILKEYIRVQTKDRGTTDYDR